MGCPKGRLPLAHRDSALPVTHPFVNELDVPNHERHIAAMSAAPLRAVRNHLSELVDRVEKQRERVAVTRNGCAVVVLVNPEDLAELEPTLPRPPRRSRRPHDAPTPAQSQDVPLRQVGDHAA